MMQRLNPLDANHVNVHIDTYGKPKSNLITFRFVLMINTNRIIIIYVF